MRISDWSSDVCSSDLGAPAMYLLLSAERGEIAPAPLLRFAVCGAAPMPAPAIAAFEARYAVPVLEGYGLTESTVGAPLNPLDGPRRPASGGAIGRAACREREWRYVSDSEVAGTNKKKKNK